MACNSFYNSKTAKIDSYFTNISFHMLPSHSSEKIYRCFEVSMHGFYYF